MATATSSLERPMPHNVEAERSILGAILLDNNAINAAIEKLKPEDFFHDHHRRIYQQMITLGEAQQAIDLVTLTEQLQRGGELEAVGGAAYVSQLMDGVPHITNVEHYARIVKEKSLLRGLIHATSAIQQQALEAEEDADAILDRAESSIFQLAEDRVRMGLEAPGKDRGAGAGNRAAQRPCRQRSAANVGEPRNQRRALRLDDHVIE